MTAMELTALFAAFLVGLAGSAHCFGMCGGLSAALVATERVSAGRALANNLLYQLGRIGGYAVIGAIAGSFATALRSLPNFIPNLIGMSVALRIASGIILLLLGIRILSKINFLLPLERVGASFWRKLRPLTAKIMSAPNISRQLLFGLVWGWLPCGMVYSIATLALLSGGAAQGAMLMLAFGVGTLPAMILTTALASRLRRWQASSTSRIASGSALVAFALFFIAAPIYLANVHALHDHKVGAIAPSHVHVH